MLDAQHLIYKPIRDNMGLHGWPVRKSSIMCLVILGLKKLMLCISAFITEKNRVGR